ncbi:MAG TPA: hypothetical protein VK590_16020, partial [Saprospiraceae bacterium]|nr:hypothetical protein [Saprospiraceae bacterium]
MADIDYSKYGASQDQKKNIDYSQYGAEPNDTEIKPDNSIDTFLGKMSKPTPDEFKPDKDTINQMAMMATPGGIVKPLLKGAEMIPGVGNALRSAQSVVSQNPFLNKLMQVLGTGTEGAGIGAVSNPQHPVAGAITGFGLGAGGHAIGAGFSQMKPLYQKAKNIWNAPSQMQQELPSSPEFPQLQLPKPDENSLSLEEHVPEAPQAANDLLENLGKGSTNKEEASTKLASMVRDKFDQREAEAGQFFEHPMKTAGDEELYQTVNPLMTTKMDKLKDILGKLKGLNVGPLYERFKKTPTISNGHWLQSELGSVIGDLERNTEKTPADRTTISTIRGIRKQLQNDIGDAFERHDKNSNDNLAPMYQRGVNFWRENVEPYLSSPELREITRNRVETPKNIENIFNTPTNFAKGEKTKIGPVNKIINDLPEDAKDLILYNRVGASKNVGNHEKLLNDLNSARNEGYSSYFNPHVKKAMEDISEKSKNDVSNKESIEARNKERIKNRQQLYKNAVTEAKAKHANKIAEMKYAHKAETSKAKNALAEAKYRRNVLLGS